MCRLRLTAGVVLKAAQECEAVKAWPMLKKSPPGLQRRVAASSSRLEQDLAEVERAGVWR